MKTVPDMFLRSFHQEFRTASSAREIRTPAEFHELMALLSVAHGRRLPAGHREELRQHHVP
jgi:hypothetical protein